MRVHLDLLIDFVVKKHMSDQYSQTSTLFYPGWTSYRRHLLVPCASLETPLRHNQIFPGSSKKNINSGWIWKIILRACEDEGLHPPSVSNSHELRTLMVTRSLHCNTPINDILSVCYRPIYSVITNHYLCDVSTVDVDGFHCLGQVVAAPNVGEYSFPKTLQTMTSEPVDCIQRCSLLQQVRPCFDFAGSHSNVITLVMVILHGQVNVSQGSHSNVITLVMVILHGKVSVSQGSHSNDITLVMVILHGQVNVSQGSHSNVITLVMVILQGQVNVSQDSHSNVITLGMVILHGQVNVSQGSHSNVITLVLVRSMLANWHKSFLAPGTRYHRTHFQLMNSVYSSGYSEKIWRNFNCFLFSYFSYTPV